MTWNSRDGIEPAGRAGKAPAFVFGEWLVEPQRGQLHSGSDVRKLEPKAMDVLVLLLEHAGEVVSTNQILDSVWEGRVVEEGAVHQKMSQIRAALGDHRERPTYIESIPKRGYRTLQSVKLAAVAGSGDYRAWHPLAPAVLVIAAIGATLGAVLVALWLSSFGAGVPSAEDPRVRQFTLDVPQPFADPRNRMVFHQARQDIARLESRGFPWGCGGEITALCPAPRQPGRRSGHRH